MTIDVYLQVTCMGRRKSVLGAEPARPLQASAALLRGSQVIKGAEAKQAGSESGQAQPVSTKAPTA